LNSRSSGLDLNFSYCCYIVGHYGSLCCVLQDSLLSKCFLSARKFKWIPTNCSYIINFTEL